MLRYLTAGESHGKALTAIIEGFPAGIPVSQEYINENLRRRQGGYGRGGRMKIEQDKVELLSGVRNGISLGSPISFTIKNKDWENWQEIMQAEQGADVSQRRVSSPRPGHADLAGTIKYGFSDIRNCLERASARETAVRVAVGAVAGCLLKEFGIELWGHVVNIGGINCQVNYENLRDEVYDNPLYCTDWDATQKMMCLIDEAKENGDSLGGIVEVAVFNVPLGIGSHVHWDRRLDARLAMALMSIPAIKGVEIGQGFNAADLPGSQVQDEIYYDNDKGFFHKTNNSGGIEGGITNGEAVVVRAAMKPIPTLYKPLKSVDLYTKEQQLASVERSDNCAVPAAAIVAAGVVSWEIAKAFLEKFPGDYLAEIKDSFSRYKTYLRQV